MIAVLFRLVAVLLAAGAVVIFVAGTKVGSFFADPTGLPIEPAPVDGVCLAADDSGECVAWWTPEHGTDHRHLEGGGASDLP